MVVLTHSRVFVGLFMRYVTVINRTNQILKGVWDGKHVEIVPGKHSFPETQARKFREQNPVMGSENPMTGRMNYKLGIEELNDDCSPITTVVDAIERWDRSKLVGAKPSEVVDGDNGLYALGRTAGSPPLPYDAGFVNPES